MTASLDVTHYCHVSAELTRPLYRYLTLDSKGIRESLQQGRLISISLSMPPAARDLRNAPTRAADKSVLLASAGQPK